MIPPNLLEKLNGVADLLTLLLLATICMLIGMGLTGTVLATRAFFSEAVDQLDLISLGHSGLRRLLMGLVNGPAIFIIAAILSKLGPLKLIGIALIITLLLLAFFGLIAEMALIGRRVLALRSLQSSIFAQTIAGGLTISSIFLLPFAGQIILLVILFKSLGTGLYWLFKRSKLP